MDRSHFFPTGPDHTGPNETPSVELLERSQRLEALLAQTSRSLRTLEEQLSSSEVIASFGHFKIDAQDRFLLSRSARLLLGVARDRAHVDEALAHAGATDIDRITDAIRRLAQSGRQVDEEIPLHLPGQGTRWLRIVVRQTQSGPATELFGLIIDTTDTRREAARRDVALKVSEALLQDVDSQAAYEWVLRTVCVGFDWDVGSCWLTDAAGEKLQCLAAWSSEEPALGSLIAVIRGREVVRGEGMVGAVLASRAASWAEAVGDDGRFAARAEARAAGIRTAYTFPIIADGERCIGVLQFLSRKPRSFDAQLPGLSELIGALMAQRVRRESWIGRLRDVAERDPLTGLLSRFALVERMWKLMQAPAGAPFAIVSFDLNRFRLINDALGHDAGDLVLCTVAERMRSVAPAGSALGRLAGDEFGLVVQGDAAAAQSAADAVTGQVAVPFSVNGYEFSLTATSGIAFHPAGASDPEALLREADQQRHRVKRSQRGSHHSRASAANPLDEIQTEHELRQGLERGELEVHYQPIVRLGHPGLAGAEALIRWNHPQRGLLVPARFLAVAEQAGLMRQISRAVLGQVTRDLARAGDTLTPDVRININLSALDFRDLRLFSELGSLLREAGMSPHRYRFEVTESMLMEDVDTAERVVGLLADFGVEFAIDDFGTGYSSLAQLARLPVHELKIDHSFTHSIDTPRGKAVVRAVLDLAARLGMPVTAEGIETRAQALALGAYGCHKGQGYHFGKAMPFQSLLGFLTGDPPAQR